MARKGYSGSFICDQPYTFLRDRRRLMRPMAIRAISEARVRESIPVETNLAD